MTEIDVAKPTLQWWLDLFAQHDAKLSEICSRAGFSAADWSNQGSEPLKMFQEILLPSVDKLYFDADEATRQISVKLPGWNVLEALCCHAGVLNPDYETAPA